jgi:hypothetical protein
MKANERAILVAFAKRICSLLIEKDFPEPICQFCTRKGREYFLITFGDSLACYDLDKKRGLSYFTWLTLGGSGRPNDLEFLNFANTRRA